MLPAVIPQGTHCAQHQTQPDFIAGERALAYFSSAPPRPRVACLVDEANLYCMSGLLLPMTFLYCSWTVITSPKTTDLASPTFKK